MSIGAQKRDLIVRIDAETKSFEGGMQKSSAALRGMQKELRQLEAAQVKQHRAMSQVGLAASVAGVAIAAGLGKAVSASMGFEKSLSGLRAATGANVTAMEALRKSALQVGKDTSFSATQAVEAQTALAKAGIATADILGGALAGAASLAAAGQMEMGAAAEVAATAMTQFKLAGADVPHIADLLAAGAGKAQGDVSDLAQALNQAGLVASQTGLTIEETTGGLAAFASAGLLGSDAGTSFKTMLQRLNPQSDEAAERPSSWAGRGRSSSAGRRPACWSRRSTRLRSTVGSRGAACATASGVRRDHRCKVPPSKMR